MLDIKLLALFNTCIEIPNLVTSAKLHVNHIILISLTG